MAKIDWKRVVGTVAPTLATALGGPLAGVAVKALAGKLLDNADANETDVEKAVLGADSQTLLQLKQLDEDFKKSMLDSGIKLEEIAATDRASARQREVTIHDSWTPRVLAAIVIGGFLGCVYAVLTGKVQGITDPTVVGLIGTMVGYTSAKADQIVSYYFGSSSGSQAKDATLSFIAKKD